MQPSVVVCREHSSALISFGFAQDNHYYHEDSEVLGHVSGAEPSIVIMPHQSSKPNLSVRTHELVSMPRPRHHDASLNSHPQGLMLGHQTLSHFEMARLEKDRRDWRELAAFLRTNDPPRSNFMSRTDGEMTGKSKKHAGSLKLFRRTAAKKTPPHAAKPLQLPDSAVAARTTKGHWHIAISIPLSAISTFADDVHKTGSHQTRVIEVEQRQATPSSQPPAYRPASAQNTRAGNISPSPSQNSIHPALRKEPSMTSISNENDRNEELTGEAANVMKSYYRQERLQNEEDVPCAGPQSLDEVLSSSKRRSQVAPTSPSTTSPCMKRGTFGPVYANPNDIERNNSQRTDPRHSNGTAFSQRTLETMGHSRGASEDSASGQTLGTIVPPPRSSSRRPKTSQEGDREVTSIVNTSRNPQRTSSGGRRMEGHRNVDSCDPASSIAMAEATESLQHQLATMRNAPRSPAPTRALPDLPEVSDDGCACPNHHERSISEGGKRPSTSAKERVKERHEKVKALRMRDIAAQKAKQRRRSTHPPASTSIVCASECQRVKSEGEMRRPQVSNNLTRSTRHAASAPFINATAHTANSGISLSPIRTIASTSPSGALAQTSMYLCATPTSTSQSLPDDFLDSLLPSYDYHRLSSAAQRHSNLSDSATNISSQPMTEGRRGSAKSGRSDGDRTIRTLTPPRSLSASFASSDEEGVHLALSPHSITSRHNSQSRSRVLRTPSHTSKKRHSGLLHRNSSSVDSIEDVKEIKERMKRLERDNERILKTLQAMVGMQQGVKDLCELLNPSRPGTSNTLRPIMAGEPAARGISRTLEPAPLSLSDSPRKNQRDHDDMARRMRELEREIGQLDHGSFDLGHTVRERLAAPRLETKGGWGELSAVEPLMREVRMTARISHESQRAGSYEDEEEEGLGYNLMEQGC